MIRLLILTFFITITSNSYAVQTCLVNNVNKCLNELHDLDLCDKYARKICLNKRDKI